MIDGFEWFVGAVAICGAHALYLRSWAAERRDFYAWLATYDARAATRHAEFMAAVKR